MMRQRPLGQTGLMVSELCLGTMTWGTQNTEAEAHAQMDYALTQGVTFWDTAEMYPTNPTSAATYGTTEKMIGTWLAANPGKREQVVLASKMAGPVRAKHIREGSAITPTTLRAALESSLQRLQTDYLDLYQIHWPNRGDYHWSKYWQYEPSALPTDAVKDDLRAMLETLGTLIQEGKIRHFGISNESCWGTMTLLQLADQHGLPRVASIQNEYSLLCRIAEPDLQEVCMREKVSFLPWSPLGGGLLSEKYYGGARPSNGRVMLPGYSGPQRMTAQMQLAVDAYTDLARAHGLDVSQMALAFTLTRPFVTSTIIGATSMDQLKTDIAAADVVLSAEVLAGIEAIRRQWPMPY